MRAAKKLTALIFFLVSVGIGAGALATYLAMSGKSITVLRSFVGLLGRAVDGQRTEQMHLAVRLRPGAGGGTIEGTASLDVRTLRDGRRNFYFLLNGGLTVKDVWEERDDGTRIRLPYNQLWLVTVVELARPTKQDDAFRIVIEYAGTPAVSGFNSAAMVFTEDDIVVTASDLWYPADLQGFVQADVEVTLPTGLDLLHNGEERRRVVRGTSQTISWAVPRPVAGLALVAGRYRSAGLERQGVLYRVFLPPGVDLDGEEILLHLASSDAYLTRRYGPSGFAQIGLFAHRRLARAFHDGSGLIGVPVASFSDGYHGFPTVAHEVAHNWWGATVAEQWLRPGTGGEWIVEGFSEFSSWLALREEFGEAAFLRQLAQRTYDPTRGGKLSELSAIDNALDPSSREIIYNKGGYVTLMLANRLGDEGFDAAVRTFLGEFRYQSATDRDLQSSFEKTSKQDLGEFFQAWVRGGVTLDLSLDPQEGNAVVRNRGKAPTPAEVALWRFPPAAEAERQSISLDATTPVGDVERLILDPQGLLADMFRSNNVLPRHDSPRLLERSPRGELMVVYGERSPWMPASVVVLDERQQARHRWAFERGLLMEPAWSADGTRILTAVLNSRGRPDLVTLNTADGSKQRIGHATAASGASTGTFLVYGDRLMRTAGDRERSLVQHAGARILSPLASPDGQSVAYVVSIDGRMDFRVVGVNGAEDRLLLSWPASRFFWRWSPDGSSVFVAVAGDWDWQVWQLPLAGGDPRRLVAEAAAIDAIAVEPGGGRLALVAQAAVAGGDAGREVFVLEIASGSVRRFRLGGKRALQVAWLDEEHIAVITSDPTYATLPQHRELKRLRLSDGSLLAW